MKKNYINLLNNPQKISPSLFLSLEEVDVDGKLLLYAYIPISAQVELCSGKVYDRIGDADIGITKSTDLTAQLFGRKQKMAIALNADHPWKGMAPMELLRSSDAMT